MVNELGRATPKIARKFMHLAYCFAMCVECTLSKSILSSPKSGIFDNI